MFPKMTREQYHEIMKNHTTGMDLLQEYVNRIENDSREIVHTDELPEVIKKIAAGLEGRKYLDFIADLPRDLPNGYYLVNYQNESVEFIDQQEYYNLEEETYYALADLGIITDWWE